MRTSRHRPLLALALAVPLLLTGCGDEAGTDANTDNQVEQPPLPEGVDGAPTPG